MKKLRGMLRVLKIGVRPMITSDFLSKGVALFVDVRAKTWPSTPTGDEILSSSTKEASNAMNSQLVETLERTRLET